MPSSTTRSTTTVGGDHLDLHARRPGVAGDVAERLAQRGEELGREVVADSAVDGAVEEAARLEPERAGGLATERQHTVSEAAGGDGPGDASSPKMADRMCFTVRSRSSTAASMRATAASASVAHEPSGSLQRQAGGEQPLDDGVVQVAGDALAVLDQGQLLHPGVEPGVLDRDAGGGGEADHELLVDVGEHLGGRLVGQVQVAEDLAAHPDRHAQERPHRRVVGREPEAVGMLAQVRQPQRLGVDDEQTEDAVPLGQVADAAGA